MTLLQTQQLGFDLKGEPLFEKLGFSIEKGDVMGLVGPNGTGKSTLIKILSGHIKSFSGQVIFNKESSIAYLSQHPKRPESNLSVLEYVMSSNPHFLKERAQIENYENKSESGEKSPEFLQKLTELSEQFYGTTFPETKANSGRSLRGVGVSEEFYEAEVKRLSGGEFIKVELARVLSSEALILLLDEPTNHLDIVARSWLLSFLKNHRGATILISHDKNFIEKAINKTFFLEKSYTRLFPLPLRKAEELRLQERDYLQKRQNARAKKLKDLEDFVRRFGAKNTKARQANSRKKMIEKVSKEMETQGQNKDSFKIEDLRDFSFKFKEPPPAIVFALEDVSIGYPKKVLAENLSFKIARGEKIALVGPNGAGKSTLIKSLMGTVKTISGGLKLYPKANIGVFHQDAGSEIDFNGDPIDFLMDEHRESIFKLRSLLGAFLFDDRMCETPVNNLSGGEKNRLLLANIMLSTFNVLILDEPTNHLDINGIASLAKAIDNYPGTVIFVSHDQSFVDQCAEKIIAWTENGVHLYHGNLKENEHKIKWQSSAFKSQSKVKEDSSNDSKEKKNKANPQKLKKLEQKIEVLEAKIDSLGAQVQQCFQRNAFEEGGQKSQELESLKEELDELMEAWVELQ